MEKRAESLLAILVKEEIMKKGILITLCCLGLGFSGTAFAGNYFEENLKRAGGNLVKALKQIEEDFGEKPKRETPEPGTIGNPFIVTDEDGNTTGYIFSIYGKDD